MRKVFCFILFAAFIILSSLPASGQRRGSIEDMLQGQTLPPGVLTVLGRSVFDALESGHGNSLALLLNVDDQNVQQELGLSDTETDAIRAIRLQMMLNAAPYMNRIRNITTEDQGSLQEDISRDLGRISGQINNVLPPESQKNVHKMVFQSLGGLNSPVMSVRSMETLNLSDEQKDKVREVLDETREERMAQVDAMLAMMEKTMAAGNPQELSQEDKEALEQQRRDFETQMLATRKKVTDRLQQHLTPEQLEQEKQIIASRPAFLPNLTIPIRQEENTEKNNIGPTPRADTLPNQDVPVGVPEVLTEIPTYTPDEDEDEDEPTEEPAEEPMNEPAEEPMGEPAGEPENAPSLDEAQTAADVWAYIQYEFGKHQWKTYDTQKTFAARGEIGMRASDKLLEIAESSGNLGDKWYAQRMKFDALRSLVQAGAEEAEQRLNTFLDELATSEETKDLPAINQILQEGRFFQFQRRIEKEDISPENFDTFKTELKTWIDKNDYDISAVARFGLEIAEKNDVPAQPFVEEITAYIRSEECPLTAKDDAVTTFERVFQTALGSDLKLYGKTWDYRDFNWRALRGRHVLIQFTSTWSVPCRKELPGMKEVYDKYHESGLEIVLVYVMEAGSESEQTKKIRELIEKEQIPWIVLSETLTATSRQPKQSEFYALRSVPTMLLVDREGKVIMTDARGEKLQAKLAEIY